MHGNIHPILLVGFLGLVLLTAFVWACERRLAHARKTLTDLYFRRSQLAQNALAPRLIESPLPLEEAFAFSGWVELMRDGKIQIAGQTFDPAREQFECNSKDDNHITRAAVVSNGKGTVLIVSHGMRYAARWDGTKWDVALCDQNNLPSST